MLAATSDIWGTTMLRVVITGALWFVGANAVDILIWWGYLCREYLFPYAHTGAI